MASANDNVSSGGLLAGVRVVEVGEGLAVGMLGMFLAEQGADVVRVGPAAGQTSDPMVAAMLARGKREVSVAPGDAFPLESLRQLLRAGDVVLWGGAGELPELLRKECEEARAGSNPGLISCAIPSFPAGDSRNSLPRYDQVAAGYAGLYERMLGAPRYHDLPVPSALAALYCATGVAAALTARLRDGRGQHVEATLTGSSVFAQILLMLMKLGVPRGFMPLKLVATPFMRSWRCKDGRYAYLHITLPEHNALMLTVLEKSGLAEHARALRAILSDGTVRDPSQVGSIGEARRIVRQLETIFLERTADEWEETLGKELCCIKVRTIEEWLEDSIQAGMNDAVRVQDPDMGTLMGPGPAVVCAEHPPAIKARCEVSMETVCMGWENETRTPMFPPAADTAEDTNPPFHGLRVADLSRIIAGPCAARVMAELGAEVTSIQGAGALDWALSFHLLFNSGKRSVALESYTPAGRQNLHSLLDELKPDAIIHNYRNLDVARKIGLGPEDLWQRMPGLVYSHLNAYGDVGVWKDRPGFEQVVQAVSGIQMSYGEDGKPRLLPTPLIDIGSGLAGAMAASLGLYHRRRTGEGVQVTTHLTWVAVLLQTLRVGEVQEGKTAQASNGPSGRMKIDTGRKVVAGMTRARDGWIVVVGPRCDVERWIATAGIEGASIKGGRIHFPRSPLRGRSTKGWQASLEKAGVGATVLLVPSCKAKQFLDDPANVVTPGAPLVERRPYPGCPKPMAFISIPLFLDRTPLVHVSPPHLRGADTQAALERIGLAVPEGSGISPYPKDKPLIIWLVEVARWGYFAWRSGSI